MTRTRQYLQTVGYGDEEGLYAYAMNGAGVSNREEQERLAPSQYIARPNQMIPPEMFFGRPPTAGSGVHFTDTAMIQSQLQDGTPAPAVDPTHPTHGMCAMPQVPLPYDTAKYPFDQWQFHAGPHAYESALPCMPDMARGLGWPGVNPQSVAPGHLRAHRQLHGMVQGGHPDVMNGAFAMASASAPDVHGVGGRKANESQRSTSEVCGVSGSGSAYTRSGFGSADHPVRSEPACADGWGAGRAGEVLDHLPAPTDDRTPQLDLEARPTCSERIICCSKFPPRRPA